MLKYNLILWHPPGTGIKLLNGINHTRRTWMHSRLRYDRPPEELADCLVRVIQEHETVLDEKPEITRETVLKEMRDRAWNNVMAYSGNYAMSRPQKGYEQEWKTASAKAEIVDRMAEDAAYLPKERADTRLKKKDEYDCS